jgi:hypothetical protein
MPKRSRIGKELVERLEGVGLQIIPRGPSDAHIRGKFGPRQQAALLEALPEIRENWPDVLKALAGRDEIEAAAAVMRMVTAEENPAAVLGRKGGLKGGHARAATMTKKERSESARRAAKARWAKGDA